MVNNKNVLVFRMKQFLPNPKEDEKEEVDEFGSSRSDFGSKAYRIDNATEWVKSKRIFNVIRRALNMRLRLTFSEY